MCEGKTYYVAENGSDTGTGSISDPFKTIQKASDVMQPGDTCLVREGVYREWIKPPRGGSSDSCRITYKAAPGEKVVIKGSEQITSWVMLKGNVWKVELPDSFFGGFNPFKTNVEGGWLAFGQEYHLGELYLNGESYCEKMTLKEVSAAPGTWFTGDCDGTTLICANFGGVDPNTALTEINVRECIFFPEMKGLKYIAVDGLTMMHAAANWVCFMAFQYAAVGTYYGRSWIIQNCHITDAKCAGLVCGNDPSDYNEGFDLEETGHHIIRNNWIQRCGEAGIHGYKGWAASLIEGNLIEDINCKKQFGGNESGGMKLHHAIDVTVRNNIVRRVYAGKGGQFAGIWIDWAAQGTRITGNVVYELDEWSGWAFFMQNSHCSPVLVDNNIFYGQIYNTSRNCIFAHNLFIDCRWFFMVENMDPVYWKPHTGKVVEALPLTHLENDRNFNNIYIKKGTDQMINAQGYRINWNVHYSGARKCQWGEEDSIVESDFNTGVSFKSLENGVTIAFNSDDAPFEVKCPFITHDFIGVYDLTGQGIEDHHGNPITVSTDVLGNVRGMLHPTAGPFEKLEIGENLFSLTAGPSKGSSTV